MADNTAEKTAENVLQSAQNSTYEEFFMNIMGIHENVKGFTRIYENAGRVEITFNVAGTKYRTVNFNDNQPYNKFIVSVKHTGDWWRVREEDLKEVFDKFFAEILDDQKAPEYEAGL